MKKNITIKELSKILEVSISTVSKALNDSYEISDSTKQRIKAAAKLYNYKPNKLAVNLKSGKTNTIGVVLPSIKNFFMSRVLRGIDSVIAKSQYNIIISITNESFEKEVQSVQTLSNGGFAPHDGHSNAFGTTRPLDENACGSSRWRPPADAIRGPHSRAVLVNSSQQ